MLIRPSTVFSIYFPVQIPYNINRNTILSNSEFYYILNAINGQVGKYKVCKMHFTNLKKSGVCDIFILQKGGVSNA